MLVLLTFVRSVDSSLSWDCELIWGNFKSFPAISFSVMYCRFTICAGQLFASTTYSSLPGGDWTRYPVLGVDLFAIAPATACVKLVFYFRVESWNEMMFYPTWVALRINCYFVELALVGDIKPPFYFEDLPVRAFASGVIFSSKKSSSCPSVIFIILEEFRGFLTIFESLI